MSKTNNFFFRPFLLEGSDEIPIPETKPVNSCPDIISYGDKPIHNFKEILKENYSEDLKKMISLKQGYDNYLYVRGKNDSDKSVTKKIYLYYVPDKLKDWPFLWKKLKTASGNEYVTVSDVKENEIAVGDDCFIWQQVPPLPDGSNEYCLIARAVIEVAGNGMTNNNQACTDSADAEHKQESNNQEKEGCVQDKTDDLETYIRKQSYFNLDKLIRNDLSIGLLKIKPVKQDIPDMQKRKCLHNPSDGKNTSVCIIVNCQQLSGANVSLTCNTTAKTSKFICLSKTPIDKDNMTVGISTELERGFSGLITCNLWQGKADTFSDGANFSIEVFNDEEKQQDCNPVDEEQENTKCDTLILTGKLESSI